LPTLHDFHIVFLTMALVPLLAAPFFLRWRRPTVPRSVAIACAKWQPAR